ncbi:MULTISPECIES: hypothetical protein [Legionella]|uniref:hypothetical protein n=1 Tax=Legionella TaxID=445 RepID=UPI000F8E0459|nr:MULTISPECIES: hypothetical protein [Legionella]MCP0914272.1 hypothetical protein [Legionella sp. 27cVA30]RUR11773.1 hypothetical protein ELY14_00580 [Legionella septentrionalis]
MMKAFTHLCKKVNLSIFNDTLTVYPTKNGNTSLELFELDTGEKVWNEVDCLHSEFDDVALANDEEEENELGVIRYVERADPNHADYHQDSFPLSDPHYHLQFKAPIDQKKLADILSVLLKYHVLSSEEATSLSHAFQQANSLPVFATHEPRQQAKTTGKKREFACLQGKAEQDKAEQDKNQTPSMQVESSSPKRMKLGENRQGLFQASQSEEQKDEDATETLGYS